MIENTAEMLGNTTAAPTSTHINVHDNTYDDNVPDLADNDSVSEAEYDSDSDESADEHDLDDLAVMDMQTPIVTFDEDICPQPINLRRSTCL
jgi:hypothetical protein